MLSGQSSVFSAWFEADNSSNDSPAKFPAVGSVTLFFPSNHGDAESTRIYFVGFKGEYKAFTASFFSPFVLRPSLERERADSFVVLEGSSSQHGLRITSESSGP